MISELHVKYRPRTFDDVVGHAQVVRSLRDVIKKDACHAIIFTGPSGTGKTTLARIVAREVGCDARNVLEVDAATNTGIDAMRAITETTVYAGLGASTKRMVIVDEAHALSKAAWQSLLKSVEEPPAHVYWAFATTEVNKVPDTIRTRCKVYDLAPLRPELIEQLLASVCKAEDLKVADDVFDFVCRRAGGSPRRGLSMLAQCALCASKQEAADLLREAQDDEGEAIELCRLLFKKCTWAQAMTVVAKLKDTNPESVRMVVCAYYAKVAMGAKNDAGAQHALAVLDAFGTPYQQAGTAPLLLSLGRLLLA
jgi:DNA polymerase-3 subunit gamma/tau